MGISGGEAKLKGIKTERDKDGELRVKRKEVFYGPLGYTVFICWYFDFDTRLCSIYQNRPETCRNFDCKTDKRVQANWLPLMRGDFAPCLFE